MSKPTLPARTDVVVVGGGVMGTSAAFFLAQSSDRDVVLVEKDRLAAGSTGDSSAILRHHYGPDELYAEMAWWSHGFYRRFEEETGAPLAYDSSPLVRFAAAGTAGGRYAEDGYDVLSELGVPVSKRVGDELGDAYPMYTTDEFDLAVSDDAAAYSDGTDAAMGFARGARTHGAYIATGVAVEAIEHEAETVTGVRTSHGRIDCDAVVVAAGPWTPRLAATVGVDVPITPVREQVVLLDPPEAYADRYPSLTPTTSVPGGEWYIRPDFGGGVLVATHKHTEPVDPDEYDGTPDEETVLDLVDRLEAAVPELADAELKGRYCGVYSTTPDHDFIIDETDVSGCYLACGFSGHGFKHAPAVGRLTADLVLDGDSDRFDLEYFSLDRFAEHPDGHGRPADNI